MCATEAHVHELVPKAPTGEPLALLVDTSAVPATVTAITAATADPNAARDVDRSDRDAAADKIVMANVDHVAQALGAVLGSADPKLADGVRERLSKRDVPGARWATATGCGLTYEHPDKGDEVGMVDCGMGFVSEKSQRFLQLLASATP